MKVLIAGAGPTGLTAAVELARRGIVPTVIDRKESASTLSRAVGILPSSLRTLAPSGVSEQLVAEGIRLAGVHVFRGTRRALHVEFDRGRDDAFLLALAQDRTEEALRAALHRYGGEVRYGCELVDVRQDREHVLAATNGGEELECDLLIGADGTRSAVRTAVGIDYEGFDLEETWSIADVDAKSWERPTSFTIVTLEGGAVAVVVPLEHERYRVVSNTPNALATLPLELDVTHVRREGQFTISIRQATTYDTDRVYLAGDAAHAHSPVGGRGMNLGIADAADLAERIASGTLAGYSEARHAHGASVIELSERARKFITAPGLVKRSLARLAMDVARRSPALRKRIASTMLGD